MPYPYDTAFAWPFPTLPVVIHQIEGEAATRLRSHWGESRPVAVHMVDLEIAGQRLPAVEVVADDLGEDVLLGRNVLNKLILLLDGLRVQTDVLTRRQTDRSRSGRGQ